MYGRGLHDKGSTMYRSTCAIPAVNQDVEPVLKLQPRDFLVREVLVLPLSDKADAPFQYLTLRKCGFTTMEAVRVVSRRMELQNADVTYAGLKDEDGITEQLIAVPSSAMATLPDPAGLSIFESDSRWLQLQPYGRGESPLQIGVLEGNSFKVTVRNLAPAHADALARQKKTHLFFLNYYDTQRFGVPGRPKHTHLIGRALLQQDCATALRTLISLESPESELAGRWTGDPEDYFAQQDPRTVSFYLAAFGSYEWNSSLRETVAAAARSETYSRNLEGHTYDYVSSDDAAVKVLTMARALPQARYTYKDRQIASSTSMRPTVVQTQVTVSDAVEDEHFSERSRVQLSFFLPSGCYATSAVRQLLGYSLPASAPRAIPRAK
jgi:tRNA pseudouridine13 synthase